MCVSHILFCYLNLVVLTTWTLTMDHLKDLTGLDLLELGNYNGYD